MIEAIIPEAPTSIGYRKRSGAPIRAAISSAARIVTIYDS